MDAPQRGDRDRPRDRRHGAGHPELPVPVPAARSQPPAAARPVPGPGRRDHRRACAAARRPGTLPAPRQQPALRPRARRGAQGPGVRGQARGPSGARSPRHRLPRPRARHRHQRPLAPAGVARRPRDRPAYQGRRRGRDLPPVLAVGPDRRDRGTLRGGGQDRPDPDGRHGPGDVRGPRRGARRDPGLLARLRPRPDARARRQARFDLLGAAIGLVILSPDPGRHRRRDRARRWPPDPVPPDPGRAPRSPVLGRQVPVDGPRRRGASRRPRRSQRAQRPRVQAGRGPAGDEGRAASCGARPSTSCPSYGTCSGAR